MTPYEHVRCALLEVQARYGDDEWVTDTLIKNALAALPEIRRQALEEAAKVVDERAKLMWEINERNDREDFGWDCLADEHEYVAEKIRALADK